MNYVLAILFIVILVFLIYLNNNDDFLHSSPYIRGYSMYSDELDRPPSYDPRYWGQSNW